ncbi:MAG TPA: hypothetical protein VMU89_23945 [Thermomicrobiaceae bacterium]|nr:hypothetical protein [Thermomicrobiaceae bacterium]
MQRSWNHRSKSAAMATTISQLALELLDAALQLVEEAKLADRQRTEALGATEAYVREWWQQARR